MGIAIAEELASKGAIVDVVMGPSNISSVHPNINQIDVVSADQMYQEVDKRFDSKDIAVFAAAVADYKPEKVHQKKIKKSDDNLTIRLKKNKDILSSMSSKRSDNQTIVGFALETDNEIENAIKKIQSKDIDMIVMNSTNDKGATFGYDTNKVTIIDKDLTVKEFALKDKQDIAKDIVSVITDKLNKS